MRHQVENMKETIEWISVEEMGKYLRIGRSTAYELIRRPDFPHVRIGRVIRISLLDLHEWLKKQQQN